MATPQQATAALILPGLNGPHSAAYRDRYAALASALESGGISPRLLSYPGQRQADGTHLGVFSPKSAAESAVQAITALEDEGQPFVTVGISFGATATLMAAHQLRQAGTPIDAWQAALLWGPIPLWRHWHLGQISQELVGETRMIEPAENYWNEIWPIEYLLKETSTPACTVAVGSLDPVVSRAFLDDLQDLCSRDDPRTYRRIRPNHQFVIVAGCGHNPQPSESGWDSFVQVTTGLAKPVGATNA